jgi:hypothetical protein
MSRACAAVIALGLAAGCGNPGPGPASPPPPPPADAAIPDALPLDRDYARLAERAVALYEDIAAAFRDADQDCPRATAALGGLAAEYGDVVAANAKVLHEGRARELKPALAGHEERFDAAARAIVQSPTMASCADDPAFTQAFDELVAPP